MDERFVHELGRSGVFAVEEAEDSESRVVSLSERRTRQVNRFPPEFYQYFSLDVAS